MVADFFGRTRVDNLEEWHTRQAVRIDLVRIYLPLQKCHQLLLYSEVLVLVYGGQQD